MCCTGDQWASDFFVYVNELPGNPVQNADSDSLGLEWVLSSAFLMNCQLKPLIWSSHFEW